MFPSTMYIPVFGQSSVAASGLGECVPLKVDMDALLPSVALSLSVQGTVRVVRPTAAAMDGQVD